MGQVQLSSELASAGHLYVEVAASQIAKAPSGACGDQVACHRTQNATTVVLADGVGSGPHALVAATLCISRLFGLLDGGRSPRDTFHTLVSSMETIRDVKEPYAVFSMLRVQPTGASSLYTYETPEALRISTTLAVPFEQRRSITEQDAVVSEGHGQLESGDAVLLVSDGITNAGMGNGLPLGWSNAGLARFAREHVRLRGVTNLADAVTSQAAHLWGRTVRDDCTALVAQCRTARELTILTGPPSSRRLDGEVVHRFRSLPGTKVVCGGSTAGVVARHTGQQLVVAAEDGAVAPPRYLLDGVELVTEGAVTLNQVSNLLDADIEVVSTDGPGLLTRLIREADFVRILLGNAVNPAASQLAFRQQGILGRAEVVEVLRRKLTNAGKLVVVERVG